MAGGPRKNPVLANPFYVALMIVGTIFVATALGYLVVPQVLERETAAGRSGFSSTLAAWLDRHGPLILGIEFVVMLAAGVTAMLTEDWFMRS